MKPIIITGLDIETTGFKPEDGHRITEVGAITGFREQWNQKPT